MIFSEKRLWLAAYFLLFIIAIVLCIRLVHEPDLWWQTRTGEYILEHKSVPNTDVFSYTYAGKPWLNVKWGFEIIQANVVKWLGAEFLMLPQIFANLLLLLVLLLTFKQFDKTLPLSKFAKVTTLLLVLAGLSYRMNGRPELTSYLFTAVYLLIFLGHHRGQTKWLFALIPLQLLWANMHEAFGVGMVLMGIFLVTLWVDFASKKTTSATQKSQRNQATLVILAAFLSVMLHPSGTRMLLHPYEIFTQLSENQFTAEIFGANKKAYWQMPAFLSLFFLLLSALQLRALGTTKSAFSLKTLLQKIPLFYLIIYAAFFYLSLKSYRNLPFFFIAAAPLVALQLSKLSSKISAKVSLTVVFAAFILFYISIVTNAFYRAFLPAETYGIGVSTAKNPVGAANFLAKHNISGNGFTDYLGSSYLLWHLQPHFKTFVDLRDLDVFAAEDIEIALTCCAEPARKTAQGQEIWQLVNGIYTFNYVAVLNHEAFIGLHRYLLKGSDFELVYADNLTSVYLKNSPQNQALIAEFGLKNGKDVFSETPPALQSRTAKIISKLFWPLYTAETSTQNKQAENKQVYYKYIGVQPK